MRGTSELIEIPERKKERKKKFGFTGIDGGKRLYGKTFLSWPARA